MKTGKCDFPSSSCLQSSCLVFLFRCGFAALLSLFLPATAARADAPPLPTRLPRTNLLAYHNLQGEVLLGKSKSDWQKRRAEILQGMQSVMGPLPPRHMIGATPRIQRHP